MTKIYLNVACAGMDVHYKFRNVTFRDRSGTVVRRQSLLGNGPSRHYLHNPCIGAWTPTL